VNLSIYTLLCTSLLCMANILCTAATAAPALEFDVIAERTHKTTLFTQGLLVDGDHFYESSGRYGKSLLVSYPIAEPVSTWAKHSAPFSKKQTLPERFFAEGLALHGEHLYLLTWREQSLLIYDKATLNYLKTIPYKGEGWGLTSDGQQLIRSDGSDTLFFHDPESFALTKTLQVKDGNQPITLINELEFAQGAIWANIWHQDRIIKIAPDSGEVLGEINLKSLKQQLSLNDSEAVLNGIAWDEARQGFWVTGKLWPKLFLISDRNHKI
jgi:glutamine cyclotransferase